MSEPPLSTRANPPQTRPLADVPAATVKPPRRWSFAWLLPIVAAGVIVYLAYTALGRRGPLITITFRTADGLEVQQTQVKYKAVPLGTVETIRLSDDMSHAVVRVRMEAAAERALTDGAEFWVVRPRLNSLAEIESGLETIVSGAYIAMEPGPPGGHERHEFQGLDQPPGIRSGEAGRAFLLQTPRLGSLVAGAPVLFRDVTVGEVLSYDVHETGPITLHVFVRAPFDAFVRDGTRFWNSSGLSVHVTGQGLRLEAQSLQAMLAGGIAFQTANLSSPAPPSPENALFPLYDDEADAESASYAVRVSYGVETRSSVHGLGVGSAVEMFGVQVGAVTDVRLVEGQGADSTSPSARVAFDLQPERVQWGRDCFSEATMAAWVARGLRVVVQSSSFLTGQKELALQYVPGAAAAAIKTEGDARILPSQGGGLDDITASLADVAARLSQIPFETIGKNVDATVRSIHDSVAGGELRAALDSFSQTMRAVGDLARQANAGMTPVLERLPGISEQLQQAVQRANAALGEGGYGDRSDFKRSIERLMEQVNGAARSVRLLADFLDRHPEALLRGRSSQGVDR